MVCFILHEETKVTKHYGVTFRGFMLQE